MKVWIEQAICTGDGLCCEIAPDIFAMADDGLAYVKEADWKDFGGPTGGPTPRLQGAGGLASVPEHLQEAVCEARDECPGECIFVED